MTSLSPAHIFPAAINHLLAQEAWARAKLMPHAGKVAVLDGGVLAVRLKVSADGMVETAAADDIPTVTIRMQPSDLPLIMQNRERAFSYVKIEGDADFANTISQLSQSLRWEAEDDLSKVVGDIAATRIVSGVHTAVNTAKALHQSVTENIAEYFLEENPLLIRPQAVTGFTAEVTKLRDDVARLAKRIEKLKGSKQ
ncbi:MAG: SCP2 sterol-binding domain-containing protein [Burkholderiaceae bacterium]|uniref:Ubiquinone biosynthesis accessory factor UbiJ n=1 Tax=Herminiimonas contaminans TaxID=1111140 RepID=A0ABS0ENY3_9BURK|nr:MULTISPECIES: SCP2 sterol-binding domain-containing protein [Oxalobacteraceae]MBF8176479.1 SCP2 sterol-binding domain-containing protein [Herminiimonas contaminans]MBX9798326.1 SCP2 sterol-binding domain-containing protein [Burkholderiaceae bacterium]